MKENGKIGGRTGDMGKRHPTVLSNDRKNKPGRFFGTGLREIEPKEEDLLLQKCYTGVIT